ncbi:hypothetical protein [Bradyrhizobium sp. CB2312]|uniref:hypothetical protein n=1 Tax=Bradyrhizobium sp. CB2312 TaxID=3039155 RepID=UPI0024B13851|nr:hypothetical protein [Bradyrhizobium sp. CB2312]WFU71105.1 hypothetical protein QA642_38555 [Bradyrhizobium sp. CB2312]
MNLVIVSNRVAGGDVNQPKTRREPTEFRADFELTPDENGVVISRNSRMTRSQVFPIGIDTDRFAQYAVEYRCLVAIARSQS